MPQKLTVLIPCKNERKNIRECIAAVRPLADELLVADSGSTDGTLGILREFPDVRVIERSYVNHGDFLNWAIPQARHEWVLVVDADERPTPELIEEVRRTLESPPEQIDAYWVSFVCFFLGHRLKFARWNTPALRLIRRDRCRNKVCRVHPEFLVPRKRTAKLRGRMLHYSLWTYDDFLRKYGDYTRRSALDQYERGRRTGYFQLLVRPMLRFLYLYFIKLGCLDGAAGLQVCVLMAWFNTFIKQGRLWELEHAVTQPDPELPATAAASDVRVGAWRVRLPRDDGRSATVLTADVTSGPQR